MLKRWWIAGIGIVMLGPLLLLAWPNALKALIVQHVAKKVSETTPYELTIGSISVNLFSGIKLHNLRLGIKRDHQEVLRAPQIRLGLDIWALLHKSVRITRLDVQDPTAHLIIDENKQILWPMIPTASRSTPGLQVDIAEMTLEGGQLILVNQSASPERQLIFHDVDLNARISAQEVDVDRLQWEVDSGRVHVKGRLVRQPTVSSEWEAEDVDVPVDKFLSVAGSGFAPFPCLHSGEWKVTTEEGKIAVHMDGRLLKGPISFEGLWRGNRLERAEMAWKRPGLASAVVHLQNDEGSFQVALTSGTMNAYGRGTFNVPRRTIQGSATTAPIVWDGKQVEKIAFTFSVNPRQELVDFSATNVQWDAQGENPFDLSTLRLSLNGRLPRWQTTVSLKFRNGASTDMTGSVLQAGRAWQLNWRELTIANSMTGSWTSRQPGSATLHPNHSLEIHDLYLTHADQEIRLPLALVDSHSGHLTLVINRFDPGPWAKAYRPDFILEGQMNAEIRVSGVWTDPEVDGFLNGHMNALTFKPVGLDLKDVVFDVRSSDKTLDVRRFIGKTKKGTIEIAGKSRLPKLAYTVEARKLILQGNPQLKGTADVDLHLDGTLSSPALTGHVNLADLTYKVLPKKETKTPSESITVSSTTAPTLSLWPQGTIDITLQWPRNVWYRDGVSSIETQGDLRLQKREGVSIAILTGTIRSVRGSYSYYGRAFNIESGEFQFLGANELNPLLNVEASYASASTTVYLDLTGDLQKPVLKMHSNPPLSDQDIVSVIVFGQPLSELRSRTGGPTSNQETMQAVGGVLGSYVSKGLNQTGIPGLNFDVLNIQPADQGGSQLTVGRYLTRKLFITYGQAVQGAAEKTLTADYFLTDKWSLQGASDSVEGNYLDLLFRYPLNKRGAATNTPPIPKSPFRNTLDQPLYPLQLPQR